MAKKIISIGIPCFNEEQNVPIAYKELKKVTGKHISYIFEFIFVDNGSSDNTREQIKRLAKNDKNVLGVFLSRNFGPESSSHAALCYAHGDAYIFFPCDLQDPPELIAEFIKRWEQGYDVVMGTYTRTEDIFFMKLLRKYFYKILKAIANINIPVNADGYAIIDKKVINALKQLPEKYRFYRGLLAWVGFKTTYVTYERRRRSRGKSSYSLLAYFHHAERSFVGFSYVPLDLIIYAGCILVAISFISIFTYLFLHFVYGNQISGFVAIVICILFFGGIQLMAISAIGKYIQVIVEETKARPMYIVAEVINEKK